MSDRTQDIKNLRAVATACKNYTDSKIEDLRWELGTYDLGVDTVNGTTMLLPSPSGTIQATMVEIDGASEVSENLILLTDRTLSNNGIDCVITNQIPNVSGTASATSYINIKQITLNAGTYYFKSFSGTGSNSTYFTCLQNIADTSQIVSYSYNNGSFTLNETTTFSYLLVVRNGQTISNIQFKDMLVKGSSAPASYIPHYDGIHNLELTGLKVEGFNKWDEEWELGAFDTNGVLSSGNKVISKNFIPVEPNKTYYVYCGSGSNIGVHYYYQNQSGVIGGVVSITNGAGTFTVPSDVYYIKFNLADVYGTTYKNDICINISGSANGTYQPYVAPITLPIDLTSIEDSGGNKLFADGSLKGNENVQDIIEPNYQESAWNEVVLNGTEDNWNMYAIGMFSISLSIAPKMSTTNYMWFSNDFWNKGASPRPSISIESSLLVFRTTAFDGGSGINNITDWKAYLQANPITVQYERETHLTSNTNLSQLVKFEAHSNGSITLVNTNNQDTTSTFKYLKEVAK